jgi:predicted ABC-type ATPase
MTDRRATERLLEFIGTSALSAYGDSEEESVAAVNADAIMNAIAELQRRGDTLVHRRDLNLIIEALHREHITLGEEEVHALNRVDRALG